MLGINDVSIASVSSPISEVPEPQVGDWRTEVALVVKDHVWHHLRHLNMHMSMEPTKKYPRVLVEQVDYSCRAPLSSILEKS